MFQVLRRGRPVGWALGTLPAHLTAKVLLSSKCDLQTDLELLSRGVGGVTDGKQESWSERGEKLKGSTLPCHALGSDPSPEGCLCPVPLNEQESCSSGWGICPVSCQ